jgi:hypothetical protein
MLNESPPGLYPDEAMNGNNALEAVATGHFKVFYPENNGREGLFINLQAISLKLFGNEPWALRIVSAIFGTLTILGLYLVAKELFRNESSESGIWDPEPEKTNPNPKSPPEARSVNNGKILKSEIIALLASFFIAASFWHINFSRIGFRAILVPFFATFGIYFLLKGFRLGKISDTIWAGVFIGAGFYSYIAFRFIVPVLAIPLLMFLRQWRKNGKEENQKCVPCITAFFLLVVFVTALPIGIYFLKNPADFFGRGEQVSIFSGASPLKEFIKSNALTLGMFFTRGDCNWRHNFNCRPELEPAVAAFFLLGFYFLIYEIIKKRNPLRNWTILSWLAFMSLPATLTKEGIPHALRSIGMIPPVMILSGLGAWKILSAALDYFEKQKSAWPEKTNQLERIKKEVIALFILILLAVPLAVYKNYFLRWAYNPETYYSFATDIWHMGKYINDLPKYTKKIILVNLPGIEARGIPMPAQTVMFATDTFREEKRQEKNIFYVTSVDQIKIDTAGKSVIVPLDPMDKNLKNLRQKFPELKLKIPGDFIVFAQ